MLAHLSLFTGIGGIDLAAEWARFETVGQCEFADYPTKVLEKHWPNVPRWRDIRTLTRESFYERTGRKTVDLISGGFPCQPHSFAGKRKASDDERNLWPEVVRVIREIRPRWFLGENVRGLLSSENGRFFGRVLRDLANCGMDAEWGVRSAADVGACHKRDRVFIVAYSNGIRQCVLDEDKQERFNNSIAMAPAKKKSFGDQSEQAHDILSHGARILTDTGGVSVRNDDGLPEGLDRLKCLGNAVVPQQVYPILAAIAAIEREAKE